MGTDQLREEFAHYLAAHRVGVLSAAHDDEGFSLPVRYRSCGLAVVCALPRWSDLAYALETAPHATLVVPGDDAARRWLQLRGAALPVAAPDWEWLAPAGALPPTDRYLALRLTPRRIELIDERGDWGQRRNLDL